MDDESHHRSVDQDNSSRSTWTAAFLLIVYCMAMLLPAMKATPEIGGGADANDTFWGWEAFLYSFLLFHIPVWLANPLFAVGLVSVVRGSCRTAAITGGVATSLALFWPVYGLALRRTVRPLQLENFGTGYWLWLGCMATLLLTGSIRWWQQRQGIH